MQRVAIFHFNWGRRLVVLFLLGLVIFTGALFFYNTHTANAASDTTYKTDGSSGINKKVKALKYYYGLSYCTQLNGRDFKTTITGSDIDKGPRWWINSGGSTVRLGQFIDAWGNKDGNTACNGESDDAPGWVNDLFSVFGLPLGSDKKAALQSLGYTCKKDADGRNYTCTNSDINSPTSKNGILYKALHGPYLDGVNPLTQQPDYNAMNYFLAMNSLTTASMCKAQPGGTSNLVTVAQVQSDGSLKQSDWSVKNDGGPGRTVVAGIPLQTNTGSGNTCEESARATVKYAGDYQKWVAAPACASSFPEEADDASFMAGCVVGRINPTNYSLCLTTSFTSNRAVDVNAQNGCFIGQGQPVDGNGIPSGRLCADKYGYTDASSLSACIKGSLHRSDANYCNATYPAPDTIPGRPAPQDTNKTLRTACLDGQKLSVSGGGIPSDNNILTGGDSSNGDSKTSCGIQGIGWIVCPVISFMGDLLANAFSGLSDNFLATDTGLFDTDSGTYIAWSVFRTFANVAFVIAFLIIIFSQLTGVGVSNYGVKKLLPRIVIAAILVNLSYFICQLAVDLSNILGYSLKSIFDAIAVQVNVPTSTDASANGYGITTIVLAVIATATVAYFALSILIPIVLGALVGVLMVVLMLIARKAIIVLLIVLSPLAFVAFLLPNTESLFTKWRKAFMALLLLFPIISVVFGMSSLASQIVLQAGPGTGTETILQIMSVGIAALPFFLVPTLLKGSLNGIGSVGGKLTSFASKTGGSLAKAGGKGFGDSRLGKFQQYRAGERSRRKTLIQSGAFNKEYRKFDPRNLRNVASDINSGINNKSGTFGTRLQAGGISLAEEGLDKDTKAAAILLNSQGLSRQQLRNRRTETKDPAMRRAAVERVIQTNDITGMNQMLEESHNWSDEERIHLADKLGAAGNRPAYVGQGLLATLRAKAEPGKPRSAINIKKVVETQVANGAYSPAKIAAGDGDELTFVAQTAAELGGDTQTKLAAAASEALSDPRLSPTIGKNGAQVDNLAKMNAPTPDQLNAIK